MNLFKRASCLVLATAGLWLASPTESQAQGFGGWPYLFGSGGGIYVSERIPFFALHPPVYYDRPTYHSYGRSPFARLPKDYTANAAPAAVIITNPYVVQGATFSGPQPLRIQNPFVTGAAQ